VDHFLDQQGEGAGGKQWTLSKSCLNRLMEYNWPGNVRELENEIERLVVLAADERAEIEPDLLSSRISRPIRPDDIQSGAGTTCLPEAIMELERRMIHEVLSKHNWNKTRAAQELSISRRNLIRKVSKYNLEPIP